MYPVTNCVPPRYSRNSGEDHGARAPRQMEEVLRQANARLRLLSAITRHDISNQLTALTGCLDLMHVRYPSLSRDLEKAEVAAAQIASMIRFSREYEEIGAADPAWHDLRSEIAAAAAQVNRREIRLENAIAAGTGILADPLVTRVLYNLIENAVRYGGKITRIRFFVEDSRDGPVVVCDDDGEGIPVADKDRIFDRGFGKNTGMGLFLAREILSITGISIRETGAPGTGARFEMSVPSFAFRRTRSKEADSTVEELSRSPVQATSGRIDPGISKPGCRMEIRDKVLLLVPGK